MSQFKEYVNYDAVGLAELIKTKQVSASEVCEAAIAQIDHLNPRMNAVVHAQFADARKRALKTETTGVMSGVPFLLKDLMGEEAGEPSTMSCSAMSEWRAPHDAELVKRFKKMGLNILGRTNAPEFGIYGLQSPLFEDHVGIRGIWIIHRAGRPVAAPRQWRREWCRLHMRVTEEVQYEFLPLIVV